MPKPRTQADLSQYLTRDQIKSYLLRINQDTHEIKRGSRKFRQLEKEVDDYLDDLFADEPADEVSLSWVMSHGFIDNGPHHFYDPSS